MTLLVLLSGGFLLPGPKPSGAAEVGPRPEGGWGARGPGREAVPARPWSSARPGRGEAQGIRLLR